MEEPSCYLKHSTRRRRKTPKCMEMEMLMVPYMGTCSISLSAAVWFALFSSARAEEVVCLLILLL